MQIQWRQRKHIKFNDTTKGRSDAISDSLSDVLSHDKFNERATYLFSLKVAQIPQNLRLNPIDIISTELTEHEKNHPEKSEIHIVTFSCKYCLKLSAPIHTLCTIISHNLSTDAISFVSHQTFSRFFLKLDLSYLVLSCCRCRRTYCGFRIIRITINTRFRGLTLSESYKPLFDSRSDLW